MTMRYAHLAPEHSLRAIINWPAYIFIALVADSIGRHGSEWVAWLTFG